MRAYVPIPLFVFAFAVFVTGVTAVYATPFALSGYGLVFAATPLLALFVRFVVARMARTSRSLVPTTIVTAGGAALSLYAAVAYGGSALHAVLGLAMLALLLLYTYWYSVLPDRHQASLDVGQVFPVVTLQRDDGTPVTTADFEGAPVIYLFYRGNWCPLCQAQVREIAGLYQEIAERGAKVVLVSPQSHAQTSALAKKFDVPFEFLVDADGVAARELGLTHVGGVPKGIPGYGADTVYPTVIIVDGARKILFSDQTDNYRVRPEPQTFLDVLEAQNA